MDFLMFGKKNLKKELDKFSVNCYYNGADKLFGLNGFVLFQLSS